MLIHLLAFALHTGHSQIDQVLELARQVRAVALHHHDPDRDDDALDAIAGTSAAWAAQHAPGSRPSSPARACRASLPGVTGGHGRWAKGLTGASAIRSRRRRAIARVRSSC